MTVATGDPAADKTFTERELRKQEATLRESREKVAEMREREEELSAEIADALEAGEDPEELREEREDVRAWIDDMEPVLPILERRIRGRRRRKLRADAEDRLHSVKKRVGGLVGEAPRRAERARELARKLADQLEWLAAAPFRRVLLQAEARLLADRFDLEEPDLRNFGEGPEGVVAEVRRRVRSVSGPRDGLGVGLDDPEKLLHLLAEFDVESPAGELLDRLEALDGPEEG